MVWTTQGPVSIDLLRVEDIVTIEGGFRKIVTQWYLGVELVRQDVNLNCLMPMSLNAEQERIGGL